jgi:hypothetical protein
MLLQFLPPRNSALNRPPAAPVLAFPDRAPARIMRESGNLLGQQNRDVRGADAGLDKFVPAARLASQPPHRI